MDSHRSLIIDFITTNGKQKDRRRTRANKNMEKWSREPALFYMTGRESSHLQTLGKENLSGRKKGVGEQKWPNHTVYV